MIGRKEETEILNRLYESNKSQFVAIYGRRRVGKTYLINEVFDSKFTFKHSGLSPIEYKTEDDKINSPLKKQLKHFYNSLILFGMKKSRCPENWEDAFLMLELFLQNKNQNERQLIFIDELPWLDTPKSGFITALEGFWNTWACSRKNLMLVVCGSATTWITNNLINNHGGLYNRLTYEIKLSPFTLKECEDFFISENVRLSRYDITKAYMSTGGIPYYLNYFTSGLSLSQNIDKLFFNPKSPLKDEFDRLFDSIFSNSQMMKSIVIFLSSRNYGYTRDEIAKKLEYSIGGTLTKYLDALVNSDFIVKYVPFECKRNEIYYKLIDPFCIFYIKFVKDNKDIETDYFENNLNSQQITSWLGIAFENVCFNHINQIKKALGISGIGTKESNWSFSNTIDSGTQIDMIIERNDNIINMCEMKFYSNEFVVDKAYDRKIKHRETVLMEKMPKKSAIIPVLITTIGLKYNEYSGDFFKVITLDDLFS